MPSPAPPRLRSVPLPLALALPLPLMSVIPALLIELSPEAFHRSEDMGRGDAVFGCGPGGDVGGDGGAHDLSGCSQLSGALLGAGHWGAGWRWARWMREGWGGYTGRLWGWESRKRKGVCCWVIA